MIKLPILPGCTFLVGIVIQLAVDGVRTSICIAIAVKLFNRISWRDVRGSTSQHISEQDGLDQIALTAPAAGSRRCDASSSERREPLCDLRNRWPKRLQIDLFSTLLDSVIAVIVLAIVSAYHSFPKRHPGMTSELPNIFVTGAAGAIGQVIRPALLPLSALLRSADIAATEPVGDNEECLSFDLRDFQSVRSAMKDIDIVFHFGGLSLEADWDDIRDVNIDGTYNVFEAARQANVRRVVFASSNHVAGFYPRDFQVGPEVLTRPDSRYGVAKVFGEALGQLYVDKHGLEVIVLRIGQFRPKPSNVRMLSLWLSHADMAQLAACCVTASGIDFEVVYGISANTRAWYDNPGAERIGFVPRDNAEDYAGSIPAEGFVEAPVEAAFQGGPFCSAEFDSRRSVARPKRSIP
jgi:uronate dehydrogenase